MTAQIMVDLDRVHPVVDGRWHRALLTCIPGPGEVITTLCGRTEEVEYLPYSSAAPLATICWDCDLEYRVRHNIATLPNHPALRGMVPPAPRGK
ncbi:hypothetical protein [Amycolatopsis sp. NPDC058986]|uniref:hypothetical protein n=1 Tax=unclassified Amycolatopsis TaxID=2618356 RepID=UPI00366C3FD3